MKGFNCEKESIWNSTKILTNNIHITIDNSTSLALTPEQILSFVFFVVLEKEVSQIVFLPWYLLFPWYFLLFALKDRVLIIVKWCTASLAHRGLPGWGGWEVLEGEGGKVRERWKVKGKRFNPPLSLKYFFCLSPPLAKIEKNHPGCERGIQIIDYWQDGRNPRDGGGEV